MTFDELRSAACEHPSHPLAAHYPTPLFTQWLDRAYLPNQLCHGFLPPLSISQLDRLWLDWSAYRTDAVGTQIDLPF